MSLYGKLSKLLDPTVAMLICLDKIHLPGDIKSFETNSENVVNGLSTLFNIFFTREYCPQV